MSSAPLHALRYQVSVPGYLAVRAARRWAPSLLASGRVPGLKYVCVDPPCLPGPDWVRLRPRLCGICGSDMALLTGRTSPALSPFASFPAVLGHEVVAEVAEVGPAVPGLQPGQRVVVDPVISCAVRGLEPCPACRRGQAGLCTRTAEGDLAPGMVIGYCRDLPGGWSQAMLAHRTQVYPVPPGLSDEVAVLVEPFSVALHAVLKRPPEPGSRVLVLGSGSLGLLVLAALRLLGADCHVAVVARYPFQARLAARLGAEVVVAEAAGGAGAAAVRVAGAREYRPPLGRPVYAGGFDRVYDCVGSARSLDDSLRVAGPGAWIVVLGCVAEAPQADWSFLWARELHLLGSYVYGREPSWQGEPHTFELALRLLQDERAAPLAELVTHRFPLARWPEAVRASLYRGRYGAIKTVFECG